MLLNVAREYSSEARELRGLFEKQLKELYWAENVMLPLISNITDDAFSRDLVTALREHKIQTAIHVLRLEKIFAAIGIDVQAEKYEAMACLMKEGENFILEIKRGVVRDAAIISILQKIKHYEIACYGTMRAYALALKEEDVVTLLENTLDEEKEADLLLSSIAESHVNVEAADKEI